jgi:hypothetical protein
LVFVDVSQLDAGFHQVRLVVQRSLQAIDGDVVSADLNGKGSQPMPRFGMLWSRLENLPVGLLGLLQPAASMMLGRDL